MSTLEILHVLQSEIHSTVFAALDRQGLPHKLHQRYGPARPGCRTLPPLRQLLPELPGGSCGESAISAAVRTEV